MDVYENINRIIKNQHLTKRAFAQKLIALEPKLQSTGEVPTEKTIYKYLNGSIAIRIELLPYIAQALHITEQELFFTSTKERILFYRKLVQNATTEELALLKQRLLTRYEVENLSHSYVAESTHTYGNTKQEELITLLDYAPAPLLNTLIVKLKDIKAFSEEIKKMV